MVRRLYGRLRSHNPAPSRYEVWEDGDTRPPRRGQAMRDCYCRIVLGREKVPRKVLTEVPPPAAVHAVIHRISPLLVFPDSSGHVDPPAHGSLFQDLLAGPMTPTHCTYSPRSTFTTSSSASTDTTSPMTLVHSSSNPKTATLSSPGGGIIGEFAGHGSTAGEARLMPTSTITTSAPTPSSRITHIRHPRQPLRPFFGSSTCPGGRYVR